MLSLWEDKCVVFGSIATLFYKCAKSSRFAASGFLYSFREVHVVKVTYRDTESNLYEGWQLSFPMPISLLK